MKLYLIFVISIIIFSSALFSTLAVADDKRTYRWRLAETWGPNFPIFGDMTKKFAERVKTMSNGRLIIRVDSANKHKSPLGIFDFVRGGQYQMGHSASYYWKGKNFNTLFFTAVPFGMTAEEKHAWFYHGGGEELMKAVYEPYGILSYPGGNTGNQMGGWFRKEINSVKDFKGLKMRIPGFAGEVLAQLGAKPVNIASGELYTSLERHTIDALEWVGPSLDLRMGFPKVAQYYYNGWHEPGAELQFMVNKRAFEKLPADLQAILEAAIKLSSFEMFVHSNYESTVNLAKIKDEYPEVKIRNFPPEVMQALYDTNQRLLQEFAAKDEMTATIIQSLRDYGINARAWTRFANTSYIESVDQLTHSPKEQPQSINPQSINSQ